MSQPTNVVGTGRASQLRLIGSISIAHFVSHYYILLLPPLYDFVRTEYGVTYTELGFALTAFYGASAVLQTPAGFLVDRVGPCIVLITGLLIGALAFAIAGLVHSFWILVTMFAIAGIGNTVYHPADYALLSQFVSSKATAWAFSIHTFAGTVGYAIAPGSLLLMQNYWGWRGAFIGASLLGFGVAALLIVERNRLVVVGSIDHSPAPQMATGLQLLFLPPILFNLIFFVLFAVSVGGLQNYSVVALGALHDIPPTISSAALTGYLLLSSLGILVGGLIAGRTTHHDLVAAGGLLGMATFAALTVLRLGNVELITVMSIGGFFNGIVLPSRDMIVRAVTPPGSFGKVFGFVTTGLNIGGTISPLIFSFAMDQGGPQWVFLMVAGFSLLAMLTVIGVRRCV